MPQGDVNAAGVVWSHFSALFYKNTKQCSWKAVRSLCSTSCRTTLSTKHTHNTSNSGFRRKTQLKNNTGLVKIKNKKCKNLFKKHFLLHKLQKIPLKSSAAARANSSCVRGFQGIFPQDVTFDASSVSSCSSFLLLCWWLGSLSSFLCRFTDCGPSSCWSDFSAPSGTDRRS